MEGRRGTESYYRNKKYAAYEMDLPHKIVERFQRGDVNRTTEATWTGLGNCQKFFRGLWRTS